MRRGSLIAAMVLALGVCSCGKDRIVTGGSRPPPLFYPYPKLLNPYNVMDALRLAYERRDTTEIKIVYDDAYQGFSTDNTDPVPSALTFTKTDEVQHVAALAAAPILNMGLTLSNSMLRFNDLADPPGWTTIVNPITALEISDSSRTLRLNVPSETMEFKFVPHTPDSTSVTDTTWKIIRWTEIKN